MGTDFDAWKPVYEAIRADFGYDRTADARARDRLFALTRPFDDRSNFVEPGSTVAIAGGGPSITDDAAIDGARRADGIVAASTAVDALEARDVTVDWMVTDLDKNPDTVRRLTARGTPVAVHAHGDNVEAIERVVPDCPDGSILPTTQVAPRGHVVNVGGFTDGDRAAFLADALGADRLTFVGWDFDDRSVTASKSRKLVWAERLLYWLERRRGDRFSVLDGRRDAIDTSSLPID
ncbi:6-hydroxymethylpterin diphosphokinase MptE-like protein [Halovivax cerinus]|uniref:6-hydroxymethyl-7,8-dihydropterin pyrophosphokinase n=1 Tax=Halovivax cerinus TaxID=1487865 RepID=A0ABD5NT31_9EURY|nr:6-hydroxymethylpterin diphosphokinase MptE-like protein [Halovivax cerinus]